jgi:hypothetical protein
MFPPWLLFRGGKGVATALGVVIVAAPWASLAAIAVFVTTVALTRIMSLGSILGAIAFAVWRFATHPDPFSSTEWSLSVFSLLVPALILIRHRSNIGRMMRWEEPKFCFRRKSPVELNTPQPSAVQPSAVQPSAVQPSAVQPSAVQPQPADPPATNGRAGENGAKRHADVAPPRAERTSERNETTPPRQPADRA